MREGQVLDFRAREQGVAFRVRMDIGKPEPPLLLTLRVHMLGRLKQAAESG